MNRTYSQTEVIALIDDLTEPQLTRYLHTRIVQPVQSEAGGVFRETDVARLRLLVDLSGSYDLPDDALEMVMSLIDQLNTMRGDMRALMQAIASENDEVRLRIHGSIRRSG